MFDWKWLVRVFGALIVSMGIGGTAAGYVCVDADAVGNNDGTSWTDAYNFLSDALAATSDGEIRVAQGVYTPDQGTGVTLGDMEATFQLKNGVILKGGYAGYGEANPDARDIDLYRTILSGDLEGNDGDVGSPRDLAGELTRQENSYHVVTGSGTDETAVLDGFTIVGGNAHNTDGTFGMYDDRLYGGGMYNYSGGPTVTDCTFGSNSADHSGGGMCNRQSSHPAVSRCKFIANGTGAVRYIPNEDESNSGGAANLYGSSPMFTDCVFEGNWGWCAGGLGMGWDSDPTLERCSFIGNSVSVYGGGVFSLYNCSPTMNHCEFLGNSADSVGGGMANIGGGAPQLNWCILAGNEAPNGAGYDHFNGNSTLRNCTIADNLGDGVLAAKGNVTLINCIVVGNSPAIRVTDGAASVSYSNVEGGWTGVDNIDADPCFADADAADYHLKSQAGRWDPNSETWVYDAVTSPCIDGGDPASDWTGEFWPHGKRINMGAFGGTVQASMSESTVGSAGDCNNDDAVGGADLLMLASKWLDEGLLMPEDIDRNGIVDFYDYAGMVDGCSLK